MAQFFLTHSVLPFLQNYMFIKTAAKSTYVVVTYTIRAFES